MLKDDLYKINRLDFDGDTINAQVAVDPTHKIFDGHFPGQPVLPGVCTVEILKELVGEVQGRKMKLSDANNMKFLSLVDPSKTNILNFTIQLNEDGDAIKINASAQLEDDTSTFKIKGTLI